MTGYWSKPDNSGNNPKPKAATTGTDQRSND